MYMCVDKRKERCNGEKKKKEMRTEARRKLHVLAFIREY
jgi:hypothetical protein